MIEEYIAEGSRFENLSIGEYLCWKRLLEHYPFVFPPHGSVLDESREGVHPVGITLLRAESYTK